MQKQSVCKQNFTMAIGIRLVSANTKYRNHQFILETDIA